MQQRCFACGKLLSLTAHLVACADEQTVYVGSDCFRAIERAAADGYQPPKGGPRLYALEHRPTEGRR